MANWCVWWDSKEHRNTLYLALTTRAVFYQEKIVCFSKCLSKGNDSTYLSILQLIILVQWTHSVVFLERFACSFVSI